MVKDPAFLITGEQLEQRPFTAAGTNDGSPSMLRNSLTLTIYNVAGRVINFALFIVIANKFGATESTDWFFFNYGLVYFIVGILSNAAESALVPAWNAIDTSHHSFMIRRMAEVSVAGFLLVFPGLLLSGYILSPLFHLEIPELPRWQLLSTCFFLALQPSLALLAALNSSYLQYRQSYLLPTIHLALRSLGVMVVLAIPSNATVFLLSFAFLVGEALRLLILQTRPISVLYRTRAVAPANAAILGMLRNYGWMTLSLSLTLINPIIDLAMVGRFGSGCASLVEYAGRLRGLPVLAMSGMYIVLLGEWSKAHYQSSSGLTWRQVSSPFLRLVMLTTCLTILLVLAIDWWLPLVFFSGQLQSDLQVLRSLLIYYFLGIPLLAGSIVLSRALIVLQESRPLAFVAGLSCLCNIILNLIFLRIMGVVGVALSTTIVELVGVSALFLLLKKRLRGTHSRET